MSRIAHNSPISERDAEYAADMSSDEIETYAAALLSERSKASLTDTEVEELIGGMSSAVEEQVVMEDDELWDIMAAALRHIKSRYQLRRIKP